MGDRNLDREDPCNNKNRKRGTLHTHAQNFPRAPHPLGATRLTPSSKLKVSKNGFHYLLSDKIYFPSGNLGMLMFTRSLALGTREINSTSWSPPMPLPIAMHAHTEGPWLPLPPSLLPSAFTVLAWGHAISYLERASWIVPWPPAMVSCYLPIFISPYPR